MKPRHICCALSLACSLFLGCKSSQHSEQSTSTSSNIEPAAAVSPEFSRRSENETSTAATTPEEDAAREDAVKSPLAAKIIENPGEASSFTYTVIDEAGGELDYPEEIKSKVSAALYPALALKGRAVVFDHGDNLYVYVFGAKKEVQRLALDPAASALDYHWVSPGGSRVAVIQQKTSGEVMLDVLAVKEDGQGEVVLHRKLDPRPMIPCGSRCSVQEAGFQDDATFRYLVKGGEQDPVDPDSPPVFERVVLP